MMQKITFLENEIKNFKTYNKFFIQKIESVDVENILKIANINESKTVNIIDKSKKFTGIKALKDATETDISFFTNPKYKNDLKNTTAGVCILQEQYKQYLPLNTIGIFVDNPHYIYTLLLIEFFQIPSFVINPMISEKANIDKTAKIGINTEVQAGAFIGKNVVIGNNCKICANAVIGDNCTIDHGCYIGSNANISYAEIGQNTVIHNGASIGQCGFGFAFDKGFSYKIPQIGIVRVGNDVEIGANTTIDRGAIEDTIIGDNTKIDNLVHIGHGVKIGKTCFFAGCTGVAGSTTIGNYVQVGGHSAINGHINISDGTLVAGNSGVIKDTIPMSKIGGYPAINLMDWERINIKLQGLIKR